MTRSAALILLAALAGCSSTRSTKPPATEPVALDPRATQTLDQFGPATLPTTREFATAGPVPLESVLLYTKARIALAERQPQAAANALESAIALDPSSFTLRSEYARALALTGASAERSIAALESAAAMKPDDLPIQAELGRLLLNRGENERALDRLRLATATPQYKTDDDLAAVVNLYLARALEKTGYTRAALDVYRKLVKTLSSPSPAVRTNAELAAVANRAETLYAEIGKLCTRLGDRDGAIEAYSLAAERTPTDFASQTRVIAALNEARRSSDAMKRARELVVAFNASNDSMAILRQTYATAGKSDRVLADLKHLHDARPTDKPLLFAVVAELESAGKADQAQAMLAEAQKASPRDTEIVRRLAASLDRAGDRSRAAKVLVEASAANPDALEEFTPAMSDLVTGFSGKRLRLPELAAISVAPSAEAAKAYWQYRIASTLFRDSTAQAALKAAVDAPPPFAPAWRAKVDAIFARSDLADADKRSEADRAATSVESIDANLAAELRGRSLLLAGDASAAVKQFAEAQKLGAKSPEVALLYAVASFGIDDDTRGENTLWKTLSDWPTFEAAYTSLFQHYLGKQTPEAARLAVKVMNTWLAADPQSVHARLLQANVYQKLAKQTDAAEGVLSSLFRDHPSDAETILACRVFFGETRRARWIEMLEAERERRPAGRAVVGELVELYGQKKQLDDARRVLDAATQTSDADALYAVAHLYDDIDQPDKTLAVLETVMKLDPEQSAAANDLGYTLADRGERLSEAEKLIRKAVAVEPDNDAYRDSLGWLLYKRGKFAEARKELQAAVDLTDLPDPVVIDHLADAAYRTNDAAAAIKNWEQAKDRLSKFRSNRADLQALRTKLEEKLAQSKNGQTVAVAPIAG